MENTTLQIISIVTDVLMVIVTIGGFLWHSYTTKKFTKKQHTFDVVMQSVMDEVFQKRLKSVRCYFQDYIGENPKDPKEFYITSEDAELRAVLNHMEGLSAALKNDDIDETLFKETYRGIIIKLYETFEEHIHSHRKNKKTIKAFEHLEWLHEKWNNEKSPI